MRHGRFDLDVGAHEGGLRARVQRDDDGLAQEGERVEDLGELRDVVGVRGAVDGRERVLPGLQRECVETDDRSCASAEFCRRASYMMSPVR